MKVTQEPVRMVAFKDLEVGDPFTRGHGHYIKIGNLFHPANSDHPLNGVNLSNGVAIEFNDNDLCIPVDAEVVIRYSFKEEK